MSYNFLLLNLCISILELTYLRLEINWQFVFFFFSAGSSELIYLYVLMDEYLH